MDSKFQYRIKRRLYHGDEMANLKTPSLPLTEASVEYFQDSFPGVEGLGRLDLPMAANVSKRNKVSPCSMVMSMLYAKRLRQRNKEYLQSMSSTDVFFISMMMASKYLYDEGIEEEVYNDEWADSVGQEVEDVNQMEMDFLREMDWHLFVKPEEFDQALTDIERRLALKEGVKRGWFTYTELAVLLDWDPVFNLWNQVGLDCTKVVSLFSAVYVASLVSMMGSAAIALQLSGPMATATLAVLSFQSSHLTGNAPVAFQFPFESSEQKSFSLEDDVNASLPLQSRLLESSKHLIDSEEMKLTEVEKNHSVVAVNGRSSPTDCSNCEELEVETSEKMTVGDFSAEPCDEMDPCEEVEEKVHVPKAKRASVFSLWLLDSLLSQVWSVLGHQPKTGSNGSDYHSPYLDSHDSNCQNGGKCDLGRKRYCVHKNIGNAHHTKCKRCQSRKAQSQPQSVLSSSDRSSSGVVLCQESGQEKLTNGNVINCVQFYKLGNCLECHTAAENGKLQTLTHQDCVQRLWPTQSHNCPPQERNSNQCSSNGASSCLERMNLDNFRYDDSSPHDLFPSKVNMNSDLILPMSLMAEVPILDPIGFVTKNSGPVRVLST